MKVTLFDVGKHYPSGWVIKHANHTFQPGSITGISGSNGSGKSTLLNIISSRLSPNEGKLSYELFGREISLEHVPLQVTHCAPAISLVNKLTIKKTLSFHFKFRQLIDGESIESLLENIWLDHVQDKQVNELSSGMQQRLKLALAFFTKTSLVLLDEPTSNLDEKGVQLFKKLMKSYSFDRTFVVASNDDRDFSHCDEILPINQWTDEA